MLHTAVASLFHNTVSLFRFDFNTAHRTKLQFTYFALFLSYTDSHSHSHSSWLYARENKINRFDTNTFTHAFHAHMLTNFVHMEAVLAAAAVDVVVVV